MPGRRLQVESPFRTPQLRPAASPTDPFVRTKAGAGLSQLAGALAEVSPKVGAFVDRTNERINEGERSKGERAAMELAAEGKSYADAIKDGKIAPHQSPYFVAGAKEQMGRAAAERWKDDLVTAMATDDALKDSTDPADFDAYVAKHRGEWDQQNAGNRDQFFDTGFSYRADAYTAKLRTQFAQDAAARLLKQSDDATYTLAVGHVQDNIASLSAADVARGLQTMMDDQIRLNPKAGTRLNQTIVDAVYDAAKRVARSGGNGFKVLEVLDNIQGGAAGSKLSRTKYALGKFDEVSDDIARVVLQRESQERQAAKAAQDARVDAALSQGLSVLTSGGEPSARSAAVLEITKGLAEDGRDGVQAAGALMSLLNAATSTRNMTVETVKEDLLARIWTAGDVTRNAIAREIRNNTLSAPDAAFLLGQIEQRKNADESSGSKEFVAFNDPIFRDQLGNIKPQFGNLLSLTGDQGTRADKAEALFKSRWVQWRTTEGLTATEDERVKKAQALATEAATRYKTDIEKGDPFGPVPNPFDGQQAAPKPAFDWHTQTSGLSEALLQTIAQEHRQGHLSATTQTVLRGYGIKSVKDITPFLEAQFSLLGGGTTTPK